MARRTPLAVARAQPLRPALRLRLPALPSARALAWVAAALGLVTFGYVAARETPIFAVRSIEVAGAPPEVAHAVKGALRGVEGESLVKLDRGAVARRLAALPSVISVSVDRAFPDTLRIAVEPERPLAVLRSGSSAWVVSRRGTIIGAWAKGDGPRLPRIWLGDAAGLAPGAALANARTLAIVGALTDVPPNFPVPVKRARADDSGITLVLRGETEVRLGQPDDVPAKIAAADAILQSLSGRDVAGLEYLDVSLPERPVGKENPQVVG